MLPEDELDFEDFGDLGEGDGPDLTNEELEALEQELRSENISTLNELEQSERDKKSTSQPAPTSTPTPTPTSTTSTATLAEKAQDTVHNNLEEGETPNDGKSEPNKPDSSDHPQQQQKPQRFNNNYKDGGYNQTGFYGQQSMPMNNMYPQYPQFSNRIYVNPKFNKSAASQQMQLQQQQQRQFMEMEAQRMVLMQRQMQLQQQEQQRLAELDHKRREVAENMRKKREQKSAEAGEKRYRSDESSNDDRSAKRQESFGSSPAGGITIKGVAAARQNLPPRNIPYQPPNERRVSSTYDRRVPSPYDRKPANQYEKPSITSRLGNAAPAPVKTSSAVPNKNSAASIVATPILPIVTNGKSNTLIIKGLSPDTKEEDIRAMTNSINGGAHDIKLDSNAHSATVTFATIESAVTFRRKYNRIQMGDSHINISFQK